MPDAGKNKGTSRYNPRSGQGRLRRSAQKNTSRLGGWEQRTEDDAFIDQHSGERERRFHAGESLLKAFNRLAAGGIRDAAVGEPGEICGFQGLAAVVRTADGREVPCQVRTVLKKQVAGVKNPLCVGDRVRVQIEAGETVIAAVEPRRNQLARTDSHNRSLVHVFAANLDRLVIVCSIRDPDLKPGLIDRYLLIAAMNDLPATVVLNKCDLGQAEAVTALYQTLGVPVFHTDCVHRAGDLDRLRDHLHGQAAVIAGQSGVGKSSLVNALFPDLAARTGTVAVEGFGRHTTTSSRSYALPGGGRLVDTPGIRECAITGLTMTDVALLMADLEPLHRRCHFNDCTHRHEPDCAVRTAVDAGELAFSRYASYRSIVDEDLA